ncbi:MAG TPA: hypothetical protein VER03_11895 [Bryobacteraceae bacterium]|nr:hypothetical protein [Bryobacteraceae bacterium]
MKGIRKRPAQATRQQRLKMLRQKLRRGSYRINAKKLTEALSRAGAISLN